jgi:hypothetical protein
MIDQYLQLIQEDSKNSLILKLMHYKNKKIRKKCKNKYPDDRLRYNYCVEKLGNSTPDQALKILNKRLSKCKTKKCIEINKTAIEKVKARKREYQKHGII